MSNPFSQIYHRSRRRWFNTLLALSVALGVAMGSPLA